MPVETKTGHPIASYLRAIQAAAAKVKLGEKVADFGPDTITVDGSIMGGRQIKKGSTLCGWMLDGDRCGYLDGTPRLNLFLGKAAVTLGFKYDKSERQYMTVELAPGDAVLRRDNAR